MDTKKPVEETKGKEFYMENGVIKTKDPVDLAKSKKDAVDVTELLVTFVCWECDPTHTHFFHQDWTKFNLECVVCGKRFHNMVDVTDYKEDK